MLPRQPLPLRPRLRIGESVEQHSRDPLVVRESLHRHARHLQCEGLVDVKRITAAGAAVTGVLLKVGSDLFIVERANDLVGQPANLGTPAPSHVPTRDAMQPRAIVVALESELVGLELFADQAGVPEPAEESLVQSLVVRVLAQLGPEKRERL